MSHIVRSTWAAETPLSLRKALGASLDANIRQSAEVFRTHQRSTVVRVCVRNSDFIVKRFNAPTFYIRFRRLLTTNPARRAWNNTRIVEKLGIATPRNIACIQTLTNDLRPISYLISEYIPGTPSDVYFADDSISTERKHRTAEAIVNSITRLHVAGYIHGDLKGRNILIHNDTPYFIDLDTLQLRRISLNRNRGIRRDYDRLKRTVPEISMVLDSSSSPAPL